jgi:hypothetical protein
MVCPQIDIANVVRASTDVARTSAMMREIHDGPSNLIIITKRPGHWA